MFMGLYDAVRLAWLKSREFDRRYPLLQVVPRLSSSASAMS